MEHFEESVLLRLYTRIVRISWRVEEIDKLMLYCRVSGVSHPGDR